MGERAVPNIGSSRASVRSLLPKGLRGKLIVAFYLMSIVPLMVLWYTLTKYIFPQFGTAWDLSLVTAITVLIAVLGFAVVRGLVMPVIRLASDAQAIAAGQIERKVEVQAPDEVGSIGVALNQITQRVQQNMAQLRIYEEEAHHLNLEINRKILFFSNLLQVSNLIAQSSKIEEVIVFILAKLSQLDEAELNCFLVPTDQEGVFVVQYASGVDAAQFQSILHERWTAPWLQRVLLEHRILVIDRRSSTEERQRLQNQLKMSNAVCQPITAMGKGVGLLVSANRKPDFIFEEDMLNLLKVFAKQMAIAIENDLLDQRAQNLEVVDELTGLYNGKYMKNRLEEEIRRAIRYHRPCSMAIFNVDNFRQFQGRYGDGAAESTLQKMAELLKAQLSDVDRVGRIGPDEFLIILPERNKREAISLAERMRWRIDENLFSDGRLQLPPHSITVSGGISENPLDGSTAEELFQKASEAVKLAKVQGKNRVVAS